MSMTIGEYTVKSPMYADGWQRQRRRIGGDWLFLDARRGRHHMGAHWAPRFVWRVWGDDYTTLMAALADAEAGAVELTDHLGNTGEFMLAADPTDRLVGNTVHEVAADFIEVKGVG
jgi:hypothetical protein